LPTVRDLLALPEDREVHHELQEGRLVVSPRPVPDHHAGIPHFWVVDHGEPAGRVHLTAHHLAGRPATSTPAPATGTFRTTVPFPVRIDLDALI
jgi:hypothetical protein